MICDDIFACKILHSISVYISLYTLELDIKASFRSIYKFTLSKCVLQS